MRIHALDREQLDPEGVKRVQDRVQRRLIGDLAGEQRLSGREVRDGQTRKPLRSVLVQMSVHPDPVERLPTFRHHHPRAEGERAAEYPPSTALKALRTVRKGAQRREEHGFNQRIHLFRRGR